MTEAGWPLIPRELLPAPVKVARQKRQPVPSPDGGHQLPIFGAETTDAAPLDLVGLLAGPATLHRMGGTARISVPVDAAWRVHVLAAEMVSRGLVVNWLPRDEGGFEVRTAYSSRLNALATAQPAFFTGARIRLWVAAVGGPQEDAGDPQRRPPPRPVEMIETALRQAGLDGSLSDHGRSYLITGRQRLRRLAELVGERPASAPGSAWPNGAGA